MNPPRHGQSAVNMVLSSLLFVVVCGSCRNGGGAEEDHARGSQDDPTLPAPEMAFEELGRQPVQVPADLSQIQPAAVLPAEERTMVFSAAGPLLLRVLRADGSVLAEAESRTGQVLVVDRRTGVKLGGRTLVRGPLEERAVYSLYALPPGGVRNEATHSLHRPETEAERRARREAMERERRARLSTQPTTRPLGAPGTSGT